MHLKELVACAWGCGSVVVVLTSIHEALGSTTTPKKEGSFKKKIWSDSQIFMSSLLKAMLIFSVLFKF